MNSEVRSVEYGRRQRGFIDFGPAFLACFVAGVLVGLALPWLLRGLRFLIIWLARVIA